MPTNALAQTDPGPGSLSIARELFGDERILVLKEQLGRGWKEPMTDAELEHIGVVCQRTRLDPLAKPSQIYFIKRYDARLRRDVMTPQVSIDGLRLIASRTREYQGQVGPLFCGTDGVWKEIWLSDEPPAAAKVGVLRKGFREPIWSVATWREWAQWVDEYDRQGQKTGGKKLAPFWESKAAHMLGKTAEGMSLKRGFPEETNELELAALDDGRRAEQAALAQRYTEIMGTESASYFDGPPALTSAAGGTPPAEPAGRAEILDVGDSKPASQQAGAARTYDEVFGEAEKTPTERRTLVEHDGRIVDADSGEVLDQPAPEQRPIIAVWADNRRLVQRAQKLGLQGLPVLNNRSSDDVVAEANRVLLERITNAELDKKLAAEQKQMV